MNKYQYTVDGCVTMPRQNTDSPTTTPENNHNDHRSGSTGSSSSTGARARAREGETRAAFLHGQYVDCCEYYTQSFRRHIPIVVQRDIAERIRAGMSADVIRVAIDETQMAPRPSWAYTHAILRRCDIEGIKTLEDWRASKQRYESTKNPALQYQQREYHEDDFDEAFFFDVVAEYGDKMENK